MSYVVQWSRQAELTVAQNMDYIAKEWNNKVLSQFLSDVELALQKIRQNPLSYPLQKSTSNVRKYKINKRIDLYYAILNEGTIEILTFWNTSRNPDDLKF